MTTASAASMKWPRMVVAGATLAGLIGGAALLWLAYGGIQQAQWNAPRLAAGWAVAHGVNIYGTAQSGPFLGWIYGPVFPLYCAPAAWFGGVTAFCTSAWLLNLLAAILPVTICLRAAVRREAFFPLLALYLTLLLANPQTQGQFQFIHVDTLCIGLGLLACWSLSRAVAGAGTGAVVWAAAFATLAIGTKQVAVGIPAGLALWLITRKQYALLGQFLFWLAVLGALFWAACLAVFGAERVIFNLWWFHLHNPRVPTTPGQFGSDTLRVAANAWPWLLGFLWVWRARKSDHSAAAEYAAGEHLRAAILWVAVGVLPFGVMAAGKAGGNVNSVHSINYALVWLILLLGPAMRDLKQVAAPAIAHAALLLLALVAGGITARHADLAWRPSRQLEGDAELARQHPGKIYLPWNPLATLMTERTIRPFDDALLCLDRAGLPAPRAAVLRDIPRGSLIVYPDPVQSQFALSYLSGPRPPEPATQP